MVDFQTETVIREHIGERACIFHSGLAITMAYHYTQYKRRGGDLGTDVILR